MKELFEPLPDFDEDEARDLGFDWPLKPNPMHLPRYEPAPAMSLAPAMSNAVWIIPGDRV